MSIALVHNGIIENHEALRRWLQDRSGYEFHSQTDTEVIAHAIHRCMGSRYGSVRGGPGDGEAELEGAYALAVVCRDDPDCVVVARSGWPGRDGPRDR
jgi:glucosamine--fructose-6-phosphate aminotransferase (isomerizing)